MKNKFNRLVSCVQNSKVFYACFFLNACGLAQVSAAASRGLEIADRWKVPMYEVSGLSLVDDTLFMISDREHDVLTASLPENERNPVRLGRTAHLGVTLSIPSSQQAQWEGVAVDRESGVFLLNESENKVYQFTTEGKKAKTFKLKGWVGRQNPDRGLEGIFLMRNSHILIALETEPAALIEYGPSGDEALGLSLAQNNYLGKDEAFVAPSADELVPLAAWTFNQEGSCQLSDLAKAEDGGLLILMKGCMRIRHFSELNVASKTATPDQAWTLPSEIPHPEGLQAIGEQEFIVASDLKTVDTNLFWVRAQ